MVLKIDLEKAYDRLEWGFIRDTLDKAGFSSIWCRHIMNCVESSRMAILWNGEPMEWFRPTRGIRQGDAMSPFLFALCIERLSHIIGKSVLDGRWKGIQVTRNSLIISHLLFADDMVLFSEVNMEQINVIKDFLENFSKLSGQRVNFHKSSIFFSPHVEEDRAMAITSAACIPRVTDLGKYLGTPSVHGRIKASLFEPMIEGIYSRLNGWKTNQLSMAGRVVIAQSVLCSIPFVMQTIAIPKGVCEEIEKIVRRFIWGGMHLVKWDKVTRPKSEGGLGIRNIESMNLALLAKLGWRLLTN